MVSEKVATTERWPLKQGHEEHSGVSDVNIVVHTRKDYRRTKLITVKHALGDDPMVQAKWPLNTGTRLSRCGNLNGGQIREKVFFITKNKWRPVEHASLSSCSLQALICTELRRSTQWACGQLHFLQGKRGLSGSTKLCTTAVEI